MSAYRLHTVTGKQSKAGKLKYLVVSSMFGLLLGNGLNMAYATDTKAEDKDAAAVVEKDWEKDGGIKVLSIRRTAANYMLDFRYKVLDPEKAAMFLDRSNRPELTVIGKEIKLQIPVSAKLGPLRQSGRVAKVGKNYFMFFANPGRIVKSGDKVQVHIGDFKSKVLTVE